MKNRSKIKRNQKKKPLKIKSTEEGLWRLSLQGSSLFARSFRVFYRILEQTCGKNEPLNQPHDRNNNEKYPHNLSLRGHFDYKLFR